MQAYVLQVQADGFPITGAAQRCLHRRPPLRTLDCAAVAPFY